MRTWRTWAALACACMLAACATRPLAPAALPALDREAQARAEALLAERVRALAQQPDWSLAGRASITRGNDGGSGRIEWRQAGAAFEVTLADRTDRYAEALELIERARITEPANAAIIDSYGWVLHRLGRNEEALVELRRAFVLEKDAEIASHVGTVLWQLGRRDEAREWFEQARAIDPDNRSLRRALEDLGA